MIEVTHIDLKAGTAVGIKVDLPNAPLLLIRAGKGFLMCDYLNVYAAEKRQDVAAVVRTVTTFDEMLRAKVVSCTAAAKASGVTQGQTGREALGKMF